MVRSIDPGCEQIRGTHWPNTGRVVDWNSCRGNHLGQRPNKLHQKAGHMDAIDPIRPQKTLAARGPSTYGSRLSPGRRVRDRVSKNRTQPLTGGSDGSQFQQGRNGVSRGGAGLLQGQRAAGDAAETGRGPASVEG